MSRAARVKGIRLEVERLIGEGRSVVGDAWATTDFDELLAALAPQQPLSCRDLFGGDAMRRWLDRPGAVAVALVSSLPAETEPGTGVLVEILVCGRSDLRKADDAILRFADLVGPSARVTFHLCFDDALLQREIKAIRPILEKLGLSKDEGISHPMVTRAIAKVQRK